jgi:TetR/AcrR family transcriptional regulator, transcriptional repressor of aconitase
MPAPADARDATRRREIIEAAIACFLQFGYAKTSLDDIAKRANLSRPLLYRKFKNKEAIFGAVYDQVFESRFAVVDEVLASRASKREKLQRVYDAIAIDTWALISNAPMVAEFYEACLQVIPDIHAKHERKLLEVTKGLLGDRDVAEVFMLAVDGLFKDLPSVAVVRKRLNVLVDRFAK